MGARQIRKYGKVDAASLELLKNAMERLNLSAKSNDRILKRARTIADLAASEAINGGYTSEPIQYRSLDRDGSLG
jgi:magnesium chelatase family protein